LVEELHQARIVAIKSNAPVVFCYTDTGYRAFIDDGQGGGVEKDWLQQPGEQTVADIKLANRSKIVVEESSFTAQRTRFSGGPGISAGAIVVQGESGLKSKVIVNSIGRVRVEKL
jgi:Tfp pilus assembly protein FimT